MAKQTDQGMRERIAAAALQILEEEGATEVTMRRVAREVGITPMAIYHHFQDRQALLKEITDAEFGKLLVFFEARQKKSESLDQIMDGYLDYAFAYPKVFDYVFTQPRDGGRKYPEDFRARKSPTLNPLADAMRSAIADRLLKEGDEWELAMELWALAHGYVMLWQAGRFNLTERQFRLVVRRAVGRLIDGLRR